MSAFDLTEDACIALTDAELVDRLFDLVCELDNHEHEASQRLAWPLGLLIEETLERFAPEAARAERVRLYTADATDTFADPAADADDLLDALEAQQRRAAARMLRDALG